MSEVPLQGARAWTSCQVGASRIFAVANFMGNVSLFDWDSTEVRKSKEPLKKFDPESGT